jgi:hypothetical protein
MGVIGEVIGCPRRFGSKGGVGRGEEEEFTNKVAKGSVRINGEGEKEDFRGIEESNNRFMTEFLTSTFIMCFGDMSCSFFKGKWSRRSFEMIKGDCTNVDSNVGDRGGW